MRLFNKPLATKMATVLLALTYVSSLHAAPMTTTKYFMSKGSNGETKFSQFEPRNGSFEVIEIRSDGRSIDKGEMAGRTARGQATAEELSKAQAQKVKDAELNELKRRANAQKCQTLRNNLANLRIGGRIYEMDENGKRKYLDDSAMRQKQERTQQAINKFCAGF